MSEQQKLNSTSAVFLTISSMLGAGIFLKTKTLNILSQQNTWAIVTLMLMGIVMVISLLMSLSVIISGQTGNMGILEWTKRYCPSWFNSISVNYIRVVYQPLSLLLISIYIIELLKDQYQLSVVTTIIASIAFMLFFMIVNIISFKFATKLQLFFLIVVLVTLFVLPLIGFYDLSKGEIVGSKITVPKAKSLDALGPWMILISGFPSIFFMYDGFYNTLSLRHKLKRPDKLIQCLVIAFVIITLLYSYIIFSFKLGSATGSFADIPTIKNNPVLNSLCNLSVTCAGLLTLNSVCMSNIKMLQAAHEEYHFRDVAFIKRKFIVHKYIKNKNFANQITIWVYLIFKTLVWYVLIGVLSQITNWCNQKSDNIFNINEAIADVTSSLIFLMISTVIMNLAKVIKKNSMSDKNINEHKKHFVVYKYAAYMSSGIIYGSCIYIYLKHICGVFGVHGADKSLSAFKLIITSLFIFISAFPIMRQAYLKKHERHWHQILGLNSHRIYSPNKKPVPIWKPESSWKPTNLLRSEGLLKTENFWKTGSFIKPERSSYNSKSISRAKNF